MRSCKWIVQRCEGKARAIDTLISRVPRYESLDWKGLGMRREAFGELANANMKAWRDELKNHRRPFWQLRSRLPQEFAERCLQPKSALL